MVDHVPNINGTGANVPSQKLRKAYQMPQAERGADAVQLSSDVMKLKGADDIRLDKVMAVKQAIANGTYLTPEKLNSALDKAIDEALPQ